MPKLETRAAATVTTTEEIKLDARLEKKLRARLENYAELKTQIDSLQAALDDEKHEIGLLREKTGYQSVKLDGYTVTEVTGVTSKLDKKKLIALGVTVAQLEEATVTTPKKPYTLVTLPAPPERPK